MQKLQHFELDFKLCVNTFGPLGHLGVYKRIENAMLKKVIPVVQSFLHGKSCQKWVSMLVNGSLIFKKKISYNDQVRFHY